MIKFDLAVSELVGDCYQMSGNFVRHHPVPLMCIYNGRYPMMDHIEMPTFEPSSDFSVSVSFEPEPK